MLTDLPSEPGPPPPGSLKPTLNALQQVIAVLVAVTARALAELPAGHELTMVQWRALIVVNTSRPTRVGDVAAGVGVSMPSASRLVKRLRQRGLIETSRDAANRRAILVRLTAEGQRVTDATLRRRLELVEAELATRDPLPAATDEVLGALATALARYA